MTHTNKKYIYNLETNKIRIIRDQWSEKQWFYPGLANK